MPKIVQYKLPPGGTVVDLADNNSTALEIEGVDSKDYLIVTTTDGSESITIKGGGTAGLKVTENNQVRSTVADGWVFVSSDPTDTVPNICPSQHDLNTGIGHGAGGNTDSDQLSLIAGGVEGIRLTESGGAMTVAITGAVSHTGSLEAKGDLSVALSGTFTATNGSAEITAGSSTAFDTQVFEGSAIEIFEGTTSRGVYRVINVASATALTLDSNVSGLSSSPKTGMTGKTDPTIFDVKSGDDMTLLSVTNRYVRINGRGGPSASEPGSQEVCLYIDGDDNATNNANSTAVQINSNGANGPQLKFSNGGSEMAAFFTQSSKLYFDTETSAVDILFRPGKSTYLTMDAGAAFSKFTNCAVEIENSSPTLTLDNNTAEDTNGGRESQIIYSGLRSGGEACEMVKLTGSHIGTNDDDDGQFIIGINTGGGVSNLHFFDGPTANVGFNSIATAGYRLTLGGNDSNPGLLLKNTSSSNGDGDRISRIDFEGRKADNNTHNLARIQVQHDGTGDDDKGKLTISVNDGDDGATPSVTPFQIDSNGRTAIGTSPGTVGEVLRVRQNHTSDTLTLFENTGAGVAGEFQTNSTSNGVDILRTKNSSGITFGARADGAVFVGASSLNNKEFEVNNGTQAFVVDVQGTTSSISALGNSNSVRQQLSVGCSQGPGLLLSKYGTAVMTSQLGEVAEWIDNQTNANRSAFLADSNTDLVLDWDVGQVGIIELVDNIDKIKFYNCPQVGRVRTFTLRIKQNASAAKTVSYSTIEFYTNKGTTAVSGTATLQWSGGASHVMSTGTGDIDIVQFTAFSDSSNNVQIYGSVIGQNFS